MPQLGSGDRLQPSLLDRLTDHQPDVAREASEARVLTRPELRAAVRRDLTWLFNTTRLEPEPASGRTDEIAAWRPYEHARRSVLNFGMPAFAGATKSSLNVRAMELAIKTAIATFEPRIEKDSLSVTIHVAYEQLNSLKITIRGRMWAQPVPLELLLAADIDLETGSTQVRDLR